MRKLFQFACRAAIGRTLLVLVFLLSGAVQAQTALPRLEIVEPLVLWIPNFTYPGRIEYETPEEAYAVIVDYFRQFEHLNTHNVPQPMTPHTSLGVFNGQTNPTERDHQPSQHTQPGGAVHIWRVAVCPKNWAKRQYPLSAGV